jgi:hypothetical protein
VYGNYAISHGDFPVKSLRSFVSVTLLTATAASAFAVEKLDRAMVAVRSSETSVYLGWRLFESDPAGRVFNVYRATAGGEAVKLNDVPMAAGINIVDGTAKLDLPNSWLLARVPEREPRADRLGRYRRILGFWVESRAHKKTGVRIPRC